MTADGAFNSEYANPYFCQVDKDSSGGLKHKVALFLLVLFFSTTCA
jgi:hypothetical protein